MEVSTASMVISTPDLAEHVVFPLPHITLSLFSFSSTSSREEVKDGQYPVTVIRQVDLPEESLEMPKPKRTAADVAMLIYTSGTTGKPKACVIRNARICLVSIPLSLDLYNPKKYYPLRTYSALPLFHATALFTGLCYCIGNIGTFCLARKFSSSNFWKDVTESRATRILYIGELGRYLVSSPPSPYDRGHSCIVANGNGLRSEVWEKFRTRFQVPEIREFYRSTEGIAKLDNFGSSAAGAGQIGFAGAIRRRLEDATLIVAINLDTGVPYRDPKTGFCIRSKPGEPGEVIGRVRDRVALAEYLHNEAATEEKLLRDVFAKGDCFQRTGDLVVQQPSGWITFSDRIGDSFRWKGENVSAGEVRDHICKLDNVQDALVYGVKLQRYVTRARRYCDTRPTDSFVAMMARQEL